MNILTLTQTEGFLVIPNQKSKAPILDWAEKGEKLLEASVRKIVEHGKELGMHRSEIETLVTYGYCLGVVAHSEPEYLGVVLDPLDHALERVGIASSRAKVDVPDGN